MTSEKVLIVKNITREGSGMLAGLLRRHGISADVADLYQGQRFPDPAGYKAIFVLGGPDSARDNTIKMKAELARIKNAVDNKVPYLGVCLGMQALVKACGGDVLLNRISEMGWKDGQGRPFEIELTSEGRKDRLFEGLASPIKTFHLHRETVVFKDPIRLLATGKLCKNQVVKIGEMAYGLQGHFELDEQMFETWIEQDPDLRKLPRFRLLADYKEAKAEYEQSGKRLFTNFLKIARLI